MNNKIKKIVIATGGTGGHIFPAYSLAKHFIDNEISVEIVSDKRGIRYLKHYRDVKIIKISSATIFKKNIIRSLISILVIIYSFFKSIIYLIFNRPNLVFGTGGYSTFSICIAAKILKIPFIIYENNLHIGKTNKYLLQYSKKIFVSHKELKGILPKYEKKVCEIGNIIRKEILNFQGKLELNNSEKNLKILILGGSQAAKIFAEILPEVFKKCKKANIQFKIYQQCLPEQNNFLKKFYKDLKIEFEVFNFTHNILNYFSKSNLVITRSGSSMLAELVNVKIPFISIPLPTSADNHQLKNAIYYEKKEYSYLIEEKNLNIELFKLIQKISNDKSLLDHMINKQKQYSDQSVYEKIDAELTKI